MALSPPVDSSASLTVPKVIVPHQLLTRIRAEYREMPGLQLTPLQARRLWGIDILTCAAALATLEREEFLKKGRDGAFVLCEAQRRTA